VSTEPIVMPNEGERRTEYCIRWWWVSGGVSYAMPGSSAAYLQALLDEDPPHGIGRGARGELMQHTVTTTPWEPVLPPGVLRLDEITAQEYGGIKVAELGDGVVEGSNLVAFTDDPEQALAAVRAHFVMVHKETPDLSLLSDDEPVRWWQVYDTCGCGDTCPHAEDEDHDCARWGLPPCRWEEDVASWIGELCEKEAPGALPAVEIEVGATYTPDERVVVLRSLLTDAEDKLRTLAKKCLVAKPVLDKPFPDAPDTTPWKKYVEQPAREAYNLAVEIQRELKPLDTHEKVEVTW
jgi:hypothetical protein